MANYNSTNTGANIDSTVNQIIDSDTDLNVNSNTLVVDKSTSRVGIGTDSPAVNLDLFASSGDAVQRIMSTSGNTAELQLLETSTDGFKMIYDGAANVMHIQSRYGDVDYPNKGISIKRDDGNVGIGTASPGAALHIYKDVGAPGDLGDWDNYQLVIESNSGDTGDTVGILLTTSGDTYGGSAIVHYDTGAGGQGELAFLTKQATSAIPPVEAMRIDDSGKVGIGATAPDTLLEIAGAHVSSFGMLHLDSTDHAYLSLDASASGNDSGIYFAEAGTPQMLIGFDGSENHLRIYDSAAGVSRMVITQAGNVGIGTAAPTTGKLAVRAANSSGYAAYVVTNSGKALEGIDVDSNTVGDGNFGGAVSFGCGGNGRSGIAAYQDGSDDDKNGLVFLTHHSTTGSADAVERMRIEADGNVGIGTSSPNVTLEVENSATADTTLLKLVNNPSNGSANKTTLEFWGDEGIGSAGTLRSQGRIYGEYDSSDTTSSHIVISSINSSGSYLDELTIRQGNVGIGVSNPGHPLEVNGIIAPTAGTFAGGAGQQTTQIALEDTSGGRAHSIQTSHYYNASYGAGEDNWNILNFNLYRGAQGNVDVMTLLGGGNVGIGVVPSYRLHVEDGVDGNYIAKFKNTDADNAKGVNIMAGDSSSNHPALLVEATAGTDLLTVRAAGNVEVNTGNLVIGTAGKGIDFSASADGSGTVTSEVLDDYEEGTWTPLVKDNANDAVTNYRANGQYTKVGNICNVQFDFELSNLGSANGNVNITGLPFTSRDFGGNAGRAGASIGYAANLSITSGTNVAGFQDTNSTIIILTKWDSAQGVSYLQASDLSANGRLIGGVTYLTA